MLVNPRAWLAEAIATFCLIFFGTVSVTLAVVVVGDGSSADDVLMIAFAHGASIGLMVYAFGHISGAHINPAVTIAMIATKNINIKDGGAYIGAQLIGAIVAAFTHRALLPVEGAKVNFGVQAGPSEVLQQSAAAGLGAEIIFTFFLVLVIFMVAIHKKAAAGMAGLAIGGVIFLLHIVGVPLTGASMNPARTFGPAIASGYWDFHWIYWAGPIIGALIAGFIMQYVYVKKAEKEASDVKMDKI